MLKEEILSVSIQVPSAILGKEIPSFFIEEVPSNSSNSGSSDESGSSSSTGYLDRRYKNIEHYYDRLEDELT